MNPPNPKARYGAQKPDLSLIPPVALAHAALAHEEGARKYGAFNWRDTKVEARTYIAAAMRHLCDYADGAERASDSDVHNLGHVIACCAILLDAIEGGHLIDNRPRPGKSAEVLERLKEWKIARAVKGLEALAKETRAKIVKAEPDPVIWTTDEQTGAVHMVKPSGYCAERCRACIADGAKPAEPYTPCVGDIVRVTATEAELKGIHAYPEIGVGEIFKIAEIGGHGFDRKDPRSIHREDGYFVHANMVELVERPQ